MSGPPLLSPQLRNRIHKMCVAVTAATPAEMIERAESVVSEFPFLEFRLDALPKPALVLPLLHTFFEEHREATAIATCRRVIAGGKYPGSVEAQLDLLGKASEAGCQIVDVEIETAEAVAPEQLQRLREQGAAVLISYHDFKETADLDAQYMRIAPHAPEIIKIVSTAHSLADNLAMLRFLEQRQDTANVVGICMGEAGIVSRVLGVRAGSLFTFASAVDGAETGPGQVTARVLADTYRLEQIDSSTRVYGVAGNPIAHSLSPSMQNAAFRKMNVNAVFLPLQVADLDDLLLLAHALPLQGMSVTMPFKEQIVTHLQKSDPLSAKIGACNTVVRSQDGKLYGFNTDVAAVVRPLEKRMPLKGAKVLVLGAGGAARAAVFGLKEKGAEVSILNRSPETAQLLAKQAKAKIAKREQLAKTAFDVIVNATPAGMRGSKEESILNEDEVNAKIVFEMVYNPPETPLLRMAKARSIPVVTGVEMFVHQGARQFEIWTGQPAPEADMLRSVLHTLKLRQGKNHPHEAKNGTPAKADKK